MKSLVNMRTNLDISFFLKLPLTVDTEKTALEKETSRMRLTDNASCDEWFL